MHIKNLHFILSLRGETCTAKFILIQSHSWTVIFPSIEMFSFSFPVKGFWVIDIFLQLSCVICLGAD